MGLLVTLKRPRPLPPPRDSIFFIFQTTSFFQAKTPQNGKLHILQPKAKNVT